MRKTSRAIRWLIYGGIVAGVYVYGPWRGVAASLEDTAMEWSDLGITMLDGKQVMVSDYYGKVVVLVFVLTECSHCKSATGNLRELGAALGSGVQIIGAAVNADAKERLPAFLKAIQPTFPIGTMPIADALSYLKVPGSERTLMPRLVILDARGIKCVQYSGLDSVLNNGGVLIRRPLQKLVSAGSCAGLPQGTFPIPSNRN